MTVWADDDGVEYVRCGRTSSIRFSQPSPPCPASGRSWRSCLRACCRATASRRASSICLFHLPTGFVDRRNQPKLSEVRPDTVVTVAVTVERHRPPPPHRPRAPYNIDTFDDTNTLTITYFKAREDYLQKLFPKGELRYVSGTATFYDGHLQMVHPDRVVDAGRVCQAAADRPGLSADRRAAPEPGAQDGRFRARTHPETAGVAGRGLACAQPLSGFRQRVARNSSPRGAGGARSGKRGVVAAGLRRTARRPARARVVARAYAAAARPRQRRRGPLARTRHRRAALLADAVAAARGQRYRRRPGAAASHAAAPARRRRLGKNRGRAAWPPRP